MKARKYIKSKFNVISIQVYLPNDSTLDSESHHCLNDSVKWRVESTSLTSIMVTRSLLVKAVLTNGPGSLLTLN